MVPAPPNTTGTGLNEGGVPEKGVLQNAFATEMTLM